MGTAAAARETRPNVGTALRPQVADEGLWCPLALALARAIYITTTVKEPPLSRSGYSGNGAGYA